MANAARQVVHSHSSVYLWPNHDGHEGLSPDNLDSRLMLSWADSAEYIQLGHGSFAIKGIVKYAAAATKVSMLMLTCFNALEAAQADEVLSQLPSIQTLTLSGFHFPSILPATIKFLTVCGFRDHDGCSLDAAAADAVIWRARNLPHLQSLYLGFPDTKAVKLTCSEQLSALTQLELAMYVSRRTPNGLCLDWVRQQPLQHLRLNVNISEAPQGKRAALLQQLAALSITCLTLGLCLESSIHAQEGLSRLDQLLWTAIRTRVFDLIIKDQCTFQSAAAPLELLPHSCTHLTISFTVPGSQRSRKFVTWAALISHAANIKIVMLPGMELSVLAAGIEAPEHLQQPWQLVVTGTDRVHGLPPSQLTSGPYLLQNAAAHAAGWTA